MKLRSILKATVAFTLLVTPAAAEPVTGLIIATTIFGSTQLAAVASFVVTSALEIGAALAVTKIAGLFQHEPERQAQVLQLALGEAPRQVFFAPGETGGSLSNVWNYGGTNKTDWEVRRIALCDHKTALIGFRVNNQYIAYTGDGLVPGFNSQLAVYFRPGTLDQTPPSTLAAAVGVASSDNAAGLAEVWVAYKADKGDAKNPVWQGGRPTFKWFIRGKACYDPRKDSTVPGGSGAHRWTNPATWEYTNNPIVCRYNWARGIYAGDQVDQPGMLLLGRGLSAVEAPPERIFAWANLCDEEVPQRYLNAGIVESANDGAGSIKLSDAAGILAGTQITLSRGLANEEVVTASGVSGAAGLYTVSLSGSLAYDHPAGEQGDWESDEDDPAMRPRYAMAGVLASNETFEQQEALFAATCAGHLIQPEGGIEVEPGYAKAPVFDITDDDLLAGQPVSWSDFGSRGSRVNTIVPAFTDPAQLWANHGAPVRRSTDDIAADGGPKEETLSLQMVVNLAQAQELGEIERRRRRYERTCTIVLGPRFSNIEEGDWGYYTSKRRAGGVQLLWEVVAVSVGEGRRTTVTMRETGAEIFEFDPFADELPPTGGNLPSATPLTAVLPSGVDIDAYAEEGETGRQRPAATVKFDPPGDASVSEFLVEYRVNGTSNSLYAFTKDVSDGVLSLPGLAPDTTYQWRRRFITTNGSPTPWSEWFTFTTPDVKFSAPDYGDFTIELTKLTPPVQALINKIAPVAAQADESTSILRRVQRDIEDAGEIMQSLVAVTQQQGKQVGATIAYAKDELTTRFTEDLNAEAKARRDLAVVVSGIVGGFGETVPVLAARVTAVELAAVDLQTGKANASDFLALNAQINTPTTGIAAQVIQNSEAIALLDPSSSTATIKQLAAAARAVDLKMDELGETLQTILANAFDGGKNIAATIALVGTTLTATVTEGQSAMARSQADAVAMLQTADSSISATITAVNQASVDRDAALTIQTNLLQSWFGGGIDATTTVASKFTSESSTRASADTALGTRASALESVLSGFSGAGSVGSSITAEASVRASADTALGGLITTETARTDTLYSALTGLTGSGAVASAITSEASTRASADTALGGLIATETARTNVLYSALTGLTGSGAVQSAITSEASTRASADTALGGLITTETARTDTLYSALTGLTGSGAVSAAITSEASTRASADTSLGGLITTEASRTDTLYAALSGLTGSGDVSAAITAEASTRASADAALASTLTTLSTTVGGHTTTLATYGSSIGGLQAQWGVQINVDGRVTGLVRLDSGDTESNFVVVASNFYVYSATAGSVPLFAIVGGVAYLNVPLQAGAINASTLIADAIISHGKLVTGAGSKNYQAFGSGTRSSPTATSSSISTYTTVASVTVVGQGGSAFIIGKFSFNHSLGSGSFSYAKMRIARNVSGTDITIGSSEAELETNNSGVTTDLCFGSEILGDGLTVTYKLQISGDAASKILAVFNTSINVLVST